MTAGLLGAGRPLARRALHTTLLRDSALGPSGEAGPRQGRHACHSRQLTALCG